MKPRNEVAHRRAQRARDSRRAELPPLPPVLPPDEQERLTWDLQDPARRPLARQRLICANLRYARKLALRYAHLAPIDELDQVATEGLIFCIDRFDPQRNNKITTYAKWCVKGYLHNWLRANYSLIKVSGGKVQGKIHREIYRTEAELVRQLEREPTEAELAAALEVPEAAVAAYRGCTSITAIPLTAEASWRGPCRAQHEALAQLDAPRFVRRLRAVPTHTALEAAILEGRYVRAVVAEAEALEDIAARHGVTRQRASQVDLRLRGRLAVVFKDLREEHP